MSRRFVNSAARLRYLEPAALRIAPHPCPACGPSILIRLARSDLGVRCVRCGSSAITLSLIRVLRDRVSDLSDRSCYELSTRGGVFAFLKRHAARVTGSEFIDGIEPGTIRDGIRCEDVQELTFADSSFDICTSTEVFEHVANDIKAFSEIQRVLKPGGMLLFTVPLFPAENTVERARLEHGRIQHLKPPMFHDDHLRGLNKVLVFRDYGTDITHRLENAGFASAEIVRLPPELWWGHARPVLVAIKGGGVSATNA